MLPPRLNQIWMRLANASQDTLTMEEWELFDELHSIWMRLANTSQDTLTMEGRGYFDEFNSLRMKLARTSQAKLTTEEWTSYCWGTTPKYTDLIPTRGIGDEGIPVRTAPAPTHCPCCGRPF